MVRYLFPDAAATAAQAVVPHTLDNRPNARTRCPSS